MFSIGILELLVIAIVALVCVGPKRLPELMRQAGKFFVQAKRMSTEVRSTMHDFVREAETEIHQEEEKKRQEHLKVILEEKIKEKTEAEKTSDETIPIENLASAENRPQRFEEMQEEDSTHSCEEKRI